MIHWFSPLRLFTRTKIRLHQPCVEEHFFSSGSPITALEAFHQIRTHFQLSSNEWALKSITSLGFVNNDGTSFGWTFSVDDLRHQAIAVFETEHIRNSAGLIIGLKIKMIRHPFPSIGSPIYNVSVRGGGVSLLDHAWLQMRSQSVDLPFDFIDSPIVSSNVFLEGFVSPFLLASVVLQGCPLWEATFGEKTVYVPLTESVPNL